MSDIANEGLPNGVPSKHRPFIWEEAKVCEVCMSRRTVPPHHATMLQNVGIAHVSGMISMQAIKSTLPKIGVAGQDNITQSGTCPGRMDRGDRTCSHTHTPTTLIVQLCYCVMLK